MSTDQKTVANWNKSTKKELLAGWLVALNGNYYGKTFPLHYGNNLIGASASSSICLSEINNISSTNHCKIIFEPNEKVFYLQSGNAVSGVYINGEILTEFAKIQKYDRIQIEDATFMLFSLCDDDFSWDDFIKKE